LEDVVSEDGPKFEDYVDHVVRVDRVRIFSMKTWFMDQGGMQADLALTDGGQVLYAAYPPWVPRLGTRWVGSLEEIGPFGPAPAAFITILGKWSAGRREHLRTISMTMTPAGKQEIVVFAGEAPPPQDSSTMKLAKHIPHHIGMAVGITHQLISQPSARERRARGQEAAHLWRALMSGEIAPFADQSD
jgi:hypothetical protein